MFGALDVRVDGKSLHLGLSGPTRSLLQYLFCQHDRLTRRELLMELFWSQTPIERRRSSLNSAIWRIKKALKNSPMINIDATADCVQLTGVSSPLVEIDFIHLENAVRAICCASNQQSSELDALVFALDGCSGTPLDGLDDEWATIERERLCALRMRGLTRAMHALAAQHRYDEALDMGRRILVIEPFRESAFQEMLCLHVLNGQRARALQLFDEFAAALEGDLGIEPLPETRALRDYLASDQCFIHAADQAADEAYADSIWQPDVGALLATIAHTRDVVRSDF